MSIRHEAVRLLEGDEPRTESNIDRIVNGLLAENYTLACEKYAAEYAARPRGDTMTDDLLDRARQLAYDYGNLVEADVLWGLIERVQQTEAERDYLRSVATSEVAAHETQVARIAAERDAARGKLDKVRQWSENNLGGAQNAALLAILDGKTGD